ncbi:unnamed protein product [Ilex paraguariensis]|uniref:Uncharacterized protein n=1 Tax=Ilex paraguariensis TaxID=185542 RepID=A0ABC8RXZ0_9AQUA
MVTEAEVSHRRVPKKVSYAEDCTRRYKREVHYSPQVRRRSLKLTTPPFLKDLPPEFDVVETPVLTPTDLGPQGKGSSAASYYHLQALPHTSGQGLGMPKTSHFDLEKAQGELAMAQEETNDAGVLGDPVLSIDSADTLSANVDELFEDIRGGIEGSAASYYHLQALPHTSGQGLGMPKTSHFDLEKAQGELAMAQEEVVARD